MRPLALVILLSTAAVAGCNADPVDSIAEGGETPSQAEVQGEAVLGTAELHLADGSEVGSASLVDAAGTLEMQIALTGLEPGEKAFHLHTSGVCDGPDFTSAGGHLNPQNKTHGSMSEGGRHLGDMPNIKIGPDGSTSQTITLDWAGPDSLAAIFDEDGTAVMIHEGPDDYMTDPAGAAGARIACGVLAKMST